MVDDGEIDKLCHGLIIRASFYNTSARRDSAGEHWAIILDSDEDVKEHDSFFVAVISHSEESNFRLPVPAYTGLDGFVQCDWITEAHLPAITKTGKKVLAPEMKQIEALMRKAREAKKKSAQS